jgi:hypothetical protein
MRFENKEQVVDELVSKWGMTKSSFYNSPSNKQRNKFWTFNRTLQYLTKLERDYVVTKYGLTHKSLV